MLLNLDQDFKTPIYFIKVSLLSSKLNANRLLKNNSHIIIAQIVLL